jgi:hypothetical protein
MAIDWTQLVGEAQAGRLVLEDDVAKRAAAACDKLKAALLRAKDDIHRVNWDLQLGDFPCGHDLENAYRDAIRGDNGFVGKIQQHVTVVEQIHDVVGAQVAAVESQDATNAANTPQVNGS